MKKIVISIILCFSGFVALSQTVTEVRQMRLNAMDLFENYTTALSSLDMPDSYVKDNFLSLFDADAVVYNDILPDNSQQVLFPEQYYKKYVGLIKSYPKFSDLELGMPFQNNGKWYVTVNFKKSFGIRFKQRDLTYPEYAFDCEMLVEMTQNQQYVKKENYSRREVENTVNQPFTNVKIKKLSVAEPLSDYFVIQLNDSKLSNEVQGLYYNHEKVEFTGSQNYKLFDTGQFNINDFTFHPELNLDDHKTSITRDDIDHRYYKYNISPLQNMVGVQFSFIPKNFGINAGEKFKDALKCGWSYGIGFSLFYSRLIAKSKGGINWYANVNPGYSSDILKIDYTGGSQPEYQSRDEDGDSYTRNVSLSNFSEKNAFRTFDLPFGVGLTKSLKSVTLTADFGFWLNYTFRWQTHSQIDLAKYSGTYEDLCNLVIDQNGYYNFGTFNDRKIEYKASSKKCDFGVYAAVGVMFKLKDYWYLKTSAEYRYAFTDRMNNYEDFTKEFREKEYDPLFNSIKWHTNRLQINLGVVRRF